MFHDQFCRCRECKPPLVGQMTADAIRLRLALYTLGCAAIAAAVIGCFR